MLRALLFGATASLLLATNAQASIGDSYTCEMSRFVHVTQSGGLENVAFEPLGFTWESEKVTLTGPKFIVEYAKDFEIKFQNETFVSAGGTTWGIVQFNEKTNVLTIIAPRLDSSYAIWSKCRRQGDNNNNSTGGTGDD